MDPAQAYEQEVISRHLSSRHTGTNSLVSQCYKDSTVLLSGGGGFIGKHLVEKLIRSCDIKKAYLILRPKKGKTIQERLQYITKDPVFDVLRENGIDFVSKLFPIEGDVAELRLGLSEDDWRKLSKETEFIFHVAATINFEEPLKSATLTNIRGTREMITLAKECIKLRAFVHVSTAYSQATKDRIGKDVKDEFYSSPVPPEMMINMAEVLDDDVLNGITPKFLQQWPNTYTFTKAIAEELVRRARDELPICVVRPAIVINSYWEPKPGYLDFSCIYGPSGLIAGGGVGALHVLISKRTIRLDLVPVDYVNNAIIAAGWAAADKHYTKVYTVANLRSGGQWGTKLDFLNKSVTRKYITPKAFWYFYVFDTDNVLMYDFLSWIFMFIPGYFIDATLWVLGKPVIANKLFSKVVKLQKVLAYFLLNDWMFCDDNLLSLQKALTSDDKRIFYLDTTEVDENQHMTLWGLGVRKYIVKDGLKDTDYAIKKQAWLMILNYFALAVYILLFYKVFQLIFYILGSVFKVFC